MVTCMFIDRWIALNGDIVESARVSHHPYWNETRGKWRHAFLNIPRSLTFSLGCKWGQDKHYIKRCSRISTLLDTEFHQIHLFSIDAKCTAYHLVAHQNSMFKIQDTKKCTSDTYIQNLPIVTLSVVFILLVWVAGTVQCEVFFNTDAHKIAAQRTILRQNSVARGEDAESVYISFCEDILTNQLDLSWNGFFIMKVDS